jgi:hypothetical protein
VAQKLHRFLTKNTFAHVNDQAILAEDLEDLGDVAAVGLHAGAGNQNVV